MTAIVWDASTERFFQTGVDRGVLYPISAGTYPLGVGWNGLISVTESPSGAEPTPLFADNIKYLNLISAEEFAFTIEAYMYPVEFEVCDGSASPLAGLQFGQQGRTQFGFCYRTLLGDDVDGQNLGYKLHLIYGCLASPSEKAFNSVNDSPEAITFSWEVATTPVVATGYKPVASLTVDSTIVGSTQLAALELILYGDVAVDPRLPLPDEVITVLTP